MFNDYSQLQKDTRFTDLGGGGGSPILFTLHLCFDANWNENVIVGFVKKRKSETKRLVHDYQKLV